MPAANYYHTLGVPEDADDDTIKQRYRDLAKVTHPDVCRRPTAEAEFKELQQAFDILSDDSKRREHNAELALAKIGDEPADSIDTVLQNYGIEVAKPPKKKKKKGKKKRVEEVTIEELDEEVVEELTEDYPRPQPQRRYPNFRPPRPQHGSGRADYEGIPDGYDSNVDFLGDH